MSGGAPGTALVVGGRGFLGRHIVSALIEQGGMDVIPTLRGCSGYEGAVALDLLSASARTLRAVLASTRPTVVVNCAGAITGTAQELVDANVVAPSRLLAAMAAAAPSARYIHLGSAAEYGAAVADRAVTETDDPRPLGAYGSTKLAGTRAVLALAADLAIGASALRIFNPVGAGSPRTTLPGRVAHLLRTEPAGMPLSLGPLEAFRDYVDVRDVASAVVACARSRDTTARVYNVGSGKAHSSRELVERLLAIAGITRAIGEQAASSERSAALPWQEANIQRASAELGWSPRYDLGDSLVDLWRAASCD